jgi:hypothetical protein
MDIWEAKEEDGNNLREPRYDVLSSFLNTDFWEFVSLG